ncbi:MAG: MATE family efflux transporter [Bacillota bacterium]|nr:MATE family efflux transporter [Bacillota bacterium]
MSTDTRTFLFEQMPVRKAVFRQIAPAIFSQMIALLYNLADTYFVGMLNDPAQTAAITIAGPPFLMLTAISNLFGIGGAGMIARSLGKKDAQTARAVSSISFWMGALSALLFSFLFLLLAEPVLTLCGATEATLCLARGYAQHTVVFGGLFTVLNIMLANLVRGEGAAAQASFGVSMGGILNMLLDPLFILPQFLGMGVIGAGMATALSNLAATVYFLLYLFLKKRQTVIDLSPRHLNRIKHHLKNILSIGFPSALQYGLTVVAVAAQAVFVAKYATEATAALGITKKLDQLPLFFSIGVANGILPLIAYNHSSGNQLRRRKIFRLGAGISVGFAIPCVIVYELFAPHLAALFISDPQTITYSAAFLRRMVLAMPFMALVYPMIIQFQAMGRVREALIVSVLRKGVLDVPLLFLMDSLYPLYGCMWVQPVVDCFSLIVASILYFRMMKGEPNETGPLI